MPMTFPEAYTHDHPPVINVDAEEEKSLTFGERSADRVAGSVGSWRFILWQSAILSVWIALNAVAWIEAWDPYPFILLNLFLSMQAAYTAPMLMMSQNRQAQLDRSRAEHDYQINLKAEAEIRHVLLHLEAQNRALLELQSHMLRLLEERQPATC